MLLFVLLLFAAIDLGSGARSKRNTMNGCENLEYITGVEAIKFPRRYHANFTRPWMRTDVDAKLFTSTSLTYNFNWMKELRIKGLNVTVDEFTSFLDKHGCLFIPYGEGVKALLLGSIKRTSPMKIEGETTCDVFKIYNLCRNRFGPYLCGMQPSKPHHRVTFGIQDDQERFLKSMIDPIVVSAWNSTFDRPKTQWEFTANAVGIYDNTAGKVFLIDMTGRSAKDICDHVIAFPVELAKWKQWTGNNLIKVMRYYNLNADGFLTRGGVRNFINREVKRLFDPRDFQEYYCRFVYDGVYVLSTYGGSGFLRDDNMTSTTEPQVFPECRVVAPDARSARLIGLINKTLEEDYGDFWLQKMVPALSNLSFMDIEERFVSLDGEPTIASWPIWEDYDSEFTESTTFSSTEEYPGDWKSRDDEDDEFLEESNSAFSRLAIDRGSYKWLIVVFVYNVLGSRL